MNNKWFAIILAISLFSCRKEKLEPAPPVTGNQPVVNNLPVTITLQRDKPGYIIPASFEGLSYETGILGESPDFLNANNKTLIRLIKNLGKGILRIGGNSSDLIKWTGTARNGQTPENSLTTSDIDRLAAFSKATEWPVLFGLNLGCNNASEAKNEANYVHNSLHDDLYALQSGNEPDVFFFGPRSPKYNYNDYQVEWNKYLFAVRKEVHGVWFAGPDVTPFNSKWLNLFAENEGKNLRLLDGHYYNTGPASDPSISYKDILKQNGKLAGYLETFADLSAQYHIPYRISECNSVFGHGKPGVSDVFASALWALDFMWTVAENKGGGINFHGGDSRFVYSPIGADSGIYSARPEYYAMLAFKYGAVGRPIVPLTINETGYNFSAHATVNTSNVYFITLINKEMESSFSFTIKLDKIVSNVEVARLTAPGITSATGVTFAGSSVNEDGTFKPDITEKYIPNDKSFVINVPAGSAAVVIVR